jgi:SAM-dependent methyltransferase
MTERVLARWVEQPPAGPLVQRLRDAERERALELVGDADPLLDVASEAEVTRALAGRDAELTRVDFSQGASDAAREALGDGPAYETTTPEQPALPFRDGSFAAAVCVGPYDWRFLDAEALTAELRRVLAPGGRLVVTVPTPESPYHYGGRWSLRYYTPDDLDALTAPGFRRREERSVYQYPPRVHSAIAGLPGPLQRPFARLADRYSDRLTARGDRERAAYLVTACETLPYERWLTDALAALFRDAPEGFYDPEAGRVIRELRYEADDDGHVTEWRRGRESEGRYPPMALLGAARWRTSPAGDDRHDDRLERALVTAADRSRAASLPAYGAGPLIGALALADRAFDRDLLGPARRLYERSRDAAFEHSEEALLLYGWTFLHDRDPDEQLRGDIADGLHAVAERQAPPEGLFAFDNPTTLRHQNQMYALWGACRAAAVTDRPGYLDALADALEYTVDQRLRPDGAVLWFEPDRREALGYRLREGLGSTPTEVPEWELLFACHQTFLVTAVAEYRRAGGDRNYDGAVRRAMGWLEAAGLFERSGLGVPMRGMTTGGRFDTPGQRFKGSYEVGAALLALTELLSWR